MGDDAQELAALQRIAYGPDSSGADRDAAERRLAQLRSSAVAAGPAADVMGASPWRPADRPDASPHQPAIVLPALPAVPYVRGASILTAALFALAVAATAQVALTPTDSLAIFAAPATDRDRVLEEMLEGAPAGAEVRHLGDISGSPLAGVRYPASGNDVASVCLVAVVTSPASADLSVPDRVFTGQCIPEKHFIEHGMATDLALGSDPSGAADSSAFWGPVGEVREYDAVVSEIVESGRELEPAPVGR